MRRGLESVKPLDADVEKDGAKDNAKFFPIYVLQ